MVACDCHTSKIKFRSDKIQISLFLIEYKIWEIRQLHLVKMELKFWSITGRRHLPSKLLRLGFGYTQLPGLPENVPLLPRPLNVTSGDLA